MDDNLLAIFSGTELVREVSADVLAYARDFFRKRMNVLLEDSTNRHPLGFFYAVEKISDGITLRYHLWPENWSTPQDQSGSEIHDHIFELNSIILSGTMRHQTFDFVPADDGSREILAVTYDAQGSQLRRLGQRGELRVTSDDIFRSGTVYRVPMGTIHRADVVASPAATLVLARSSRHPAGPRVVIERGQSIPAKFVRATVQGSDLAEARSLLAQL